MTELTKLMDLLYVEESDEYSELVEMISCEKIGKTILKKTKERYLRYLEGINDWTTAHPVKDDCRICLKHIKEHIEIFLQLYNVKNTLDQQIKLMEYIDYEMYLAI